MKRNITITEYDEDYMGIFFGFYSNDKISIRKDLSKAAKKHIIFHELTHSQKMFESKLLSELYANWVAFMASPIGGIIVVFKTITSPKRLKYYKNLIFK